MGIKAFIVSTQERVNALSLRERGLLFAAIVVVSYTVIIVGLIRPLESREQAIADSLAAARVQTAVVDRKLDNILTPATRARQMARLKVLTAQVALLKARLHGLAGGLVAPRDMPALMRRVLAQAPGVMLLALANHPTVAIRRSPKSRPFLYRHEMTVSVRGSYAALVHYLVALAHTRKHVLWGRVTLKADRYPYSTLRLHIYTLSGRRALLR